MEIIEVGPVTKQNGGTYTSGVCIVVQNLIDTGDLRNLPINVLYKKGAQRRIPRASIYIMLFLAFRKLSALLRLVKIYGFKRAVNLLSIAATILLEDKHGIVWHIHGAYDAEVLALYRPINCLITLHGLFLENKKYTDALNKLSSYTKGVSFTVLHDGDRNLLQKHLGLSSFVVSNGVSPNFRYSETRRNEFRRKNHLNERFTLVTVGSIQRRKGQLEFARYLENKDLNYLIAGPIAEDQYAEELFSFDNVKYLGELSQEDLISVYSGCDCLVVNSTAEGSPMVILEAHACGLPIIYNNRIEQCIPKEIKKLGLTSSIKDWRSHNLDTSTIKRYEPSSFYEWSSVLNEYKKVIDKCF